MDKLKSPEWPQCFYRSHRYSIIFVQYQLVLQWWKRDTSLPTTTVQAINDSTRPQLNIPETEEGKKNNEGLPKEKQKANFLKAFFLEEFSSLRVHI